MSSAATPKQRDASRRYRKRMEEFFKAQEAQLEVLRARQEALLAARKLELVKHRKLVELKYSLLQWQEDACAGTVSPQLADFFERQVVPCYAAAQSSGESIEAQVCPKDCQMPRVL